MVLLGLTVAVPLISIPVLMPSGAGGTAVGQVGNDLLRVANDLVGDFVKKMSKVARGNQRQGDFEGWTDDEVNAEYDALSRGNLSKEEKALKQKLKKNKKHVD